jgi:prephenate dehydrogenase
MQLAVVGLGLIGGSLARALRAAGAVNAIHGHDLDPAQRNEALALGVIDEAHDTAAEAVRAADVVLLAVPVLRTAEALAAVLGHLKPGAVVTDVGSTKQSVLADVARICGTLPGWFVAAHPIAGTEKSGVAAGAADLFCGKRLILTPHAGQDAQALATVRALWQAAGARVVEMDASRHDAVFAATSHLPHLLAFSFVDMLARLPGAEAELFPNAGGGFRDFTRIASSNPQMWHDILRANADSVGALLDDQIAELQSLRAMMLRGEWVALRGVFERARAARERHLSHIE